MHELTIFIIFQNISLIYTPYGSLCSQHVGYQQYWHLRHRSNCWEHYISLLEHSSSCWKNCHNLRAPQQLLRIPHQVCWSTAVGSRLWEHCSSCWSNAAATGSTAAAVRSTVATAGSIIAAVWSTEAVYGSTAGSYWWEHWSNCCEHQSSCWEQRSSCWEHCIS